MGWPLDWDNHINDGLAGYWYMPEGSGNKVFDLSENGKHGILYDDLNWQPGKSGSCIYFPGGSDARLVTPPVYTEYVTFSIWIRLATATFIGQNQAIWNDNVPGVDLGWQIFGLDGTGSIRVRIDTAGGFTILDTDAFIVANKWHHYVCTFDGTTIKIYIDGVFHKQGAHSNPGVIKNTGNDRYFGTYSNLTSELIAWLDMPIIYDRVFTASEVAKLYREPFCMFKDPDKIPVLDQYYTVGVGAAGIMTTNAGYWGPTF